MQQQYRCISFDMGTRSMGVCYAEYPSRAILRWSIVDLGMDQSRTAINTLARMLQNELLWIEQTPASEPIVVELQPRESPSKTISHALQLYYLVRQPERTFHFMQADNKLRLDELRYETVPHATYADRKQFTIDLTDEYARAGVIAPVMVEYFRQQPPKQRSDLADAYIQALRMLQMTYGGAEGKRRRTPAAGVPRQRFEPTRQTPDEPSFVDEDDECV